MNKNKTVLLLLLLLMRPFLIDFLLNFGDHF